MKQEAEKMKVKDVVRAAAEALRLTDAVNFCDGKNESDAEKAAAGEAEAKKLLEFSTIRKRNWRFWRCR